MGGGGEGGVRDPVSSCSRITMASQGREARERKGSCFWVHQRLRCGDACGRVHRVQVDMKHRPRVALPICQALISNIFFLSSGPFRLQV